ncbi:hypothetical protein MGAST_12595 [Mycobacterium gastri 'Wayne']|uniref:Uncharacterized protein n=1 Tax=Mycobacterium gastri TaxID=1777 RepID=A0A1X1VHU8_MYCGS|nr:hypothetical protein MGAST_12595 [Mycobacterium gastri 'Wayne']ORV68614.1 hypothetical protein AWC07_08220 [Mycobacterium gastri]
MRRQADRYAQARVRLIRGHGNIPTRHWASRLGRLDDHPGLDHVVSRAYGVWVQGNNDTVGAAVAVVELE